MGSRMTRPAPYTTLTDVAPRPGFARLVAHQRRCLLGIFLDIVPELQFSI
jgi:hypothetical protein